MKRRRFRTARPGEESRYDPSWRPTRMQAGAFNIGMVILGGLSAVGAVRLVEWAFQ